MTHTIELTSANFKQVIDENPIVIVDFWAEWCGPCKSFAPVFSAAAEEHPDIVFAKVDTEAEEELAQMFKIRSIPMLMVFKEQIVVFSQAGALPASTFDQLIEQAKALDMDSVRTEVEQQKNEQAAG